MFPAFDIVTLSDEAAAIFFHRLPDDGVRVDHLRSIDSHPKLIFKSLLVLDSPV